MGYRVDQILAGCVLLGCFGLGVFVVGLLLFVLDGRREP